MKIYTRTREICWNVALPNARYAEAVNILPFFQLVNIHGFRYITGYEFDELPIL